MKTTEELARGLGLYSFRYKNEKELQEGVALALAAMGAAFEAEVKLTVTERIDFLVVEGIGVEIKTNDSRGGAGLSAVTRQLWRYAKDDRIKSLVLVTTRSKHRDLPREILGKPLFVVYLNPFG